ncbi:hypothetical protein Cabther_B0188 [Chloracidobacterium thermophilum B]|uniref:Uncharacterized protein n=1 Tax=Chloracidobacterium thermophilum (strain B) TaxID=981222 RepID=G2LK24_CHLTF|nr:hypothetical protein Cabther_B0188 [Chloracidobacterium thermophilum B]
MWLPCAWHPVSTSHTGFLAGAYPGKQFSEKLSPTVAFPSHAPYDGGSVHLLLLINGDVPRFG